MFRVWVVPGHPGTLLWRWAVERDRGMHIEHITTTEQRQRATGEAQQAQVTN